MLCKINDSLEDKKRAIHARTADQKMARDGVPVSIGGEAHIIRPMPRGRERQFRELQLKAVLDMDARVEASEDGTQLQAVIDVANMEYATQSQLLALAIPELEGREAWLNDHATTEEIVEALDLATEFADPNRRRVQPAPATDADPAAASD